jgi:hypothetical protein
MPGMGDTSAAIAANRRRGLEKMAAKLREAGYLVFEPERAGRVVLLDEVADDGPVLVNVRRVEFSGR